MKQKISNIKIENKILIMLAFFSMSIGLWGNFRELWMQSNNLSVTNISNVLSFSTFLGAGLMLVLAIRIKILNFKKFTAYLLFLKIIAMLILFLFNNTNCSVVIKSAVIVDNILENLIVLGIYPFIVSVKKSDKLYSKRKLTEYIFKDIGIFIGGFLIGKSIGILNFDYNAFLFISLFLLIVSLVITIKIKANLIEDEGTKSLDLFQFIRKDLLSRLYLFYVFIANVAMFTGLGLKMLMLTNQLDFNVSGATKYFLIVGIICDIFGVLALKYFTPKNDYLTLTIKFGVRFLIYLIAFMSGEPIIILIAITWSIFIGAAYENKTDAPYINRVSNKYLFQFTNLRFVFSLLGKSVGMFFCGIMYNYGPEYMLGLSALFLVVQIAVSYLMIFIKRQEDKLN